VLPAPPTPTGGADPRAGTPVYGAQLAGHPGGAGFGQELGLHLRMLVRGGLERAQLELVAPGLGPIRVRLSLREQVAQIHFSAPHEITREGISGSMDLLREMLAQQGIALGQAEVGEDGASGGEGPPMAEPAPVNRSRSAPDGGGRAAQPPVRNAAGGGLLDLYA
jgi:flagellar hook-length control protein FliK